MNLLPTFALLGLVASTSGAPKANYPINLYKKALQETQQEFNIGRSSNYLGSDYNQYPSHLDQLSTFQISHTRSEGLGDHQRPITQSIFSKKRFKKVIALHNNKILDTKINSNSMPEDHQILLDLILINTPAGVDQPSTFQTSLFKLDGQLGSLLQVAIILHLD